MSNKTVRIALFIDAENTKPQQIGQAITYCNRIGRISIRRVYGNAEALGRWSKIAAEHCIVPMQTPPSAAKQNASDFALTLDAASLLHRGLFDHAVIMSSDADFTQLAMHIRENGIPVSGMGEAKAPKALQSAYDDFLLFEAEKPATEKKPPSKIKTAAVATVKPAHPVKAAVAPNGIDRNEVLKIFEEIEKNNQVVTLQTMGTWLSELHPHYKKGSRTLSKFLAKYGLFKITGKVVSRKPA
ncbi:NYN domain-containing protein [soil metagenome]